MIGGKQKISRPLNPVAAQRRTADFYKWERRGRGWDVWDNPVGLEPPFAPDNSNEEYTHRPVDDGRKPTLLGSIINGIKAIASPGGTEDEKNSDDNPIASETGSEAPAEYEDDCGLKEIMIALPSDQKITPDLAEQFLLNLNYCTYPVSFEIIGSHASIFIQIVCRDKDFLQVRQQLKAYFPNLTYSEKDGRMRELFDSEKETVIVDFGLSHEFTRPIKTFKNFDIDPLIGVIGALENLEKGELGIAQVLFQAARRPWAEKIMGSVLDRDGQPFFLDAPEMLQLAKEKVKSPLFAAVARVLGQSAQSHRSWEIAKALGGCLIQLADPQSNQLIPLKNDGYKDDDHAADVLSRTTHRSGMILNSRELVSLVHLPSISVQSRKLVRDSMKTKEVPLIAIGHLLKLGENLHHGKRTAVSLSAEQRLKHTYLIGATGTGKSTLLMNMIYQDIKNGDGVAVLEAHGDLTDAILGLIPEERYDDVILFDPSDESYPVGLNILSAKSEIEKNVLASDSAAAFRRLSTSWGDQMTSVLSNSILAFLESDKGGTLFDLRRFLIEKTYRTEFLKTVKDPQVVYYWQKEFPLLVGKPLGPVLTRLNTFLRPKIIRNIVAQRRGLDFDEILNTRKIFLAKLAQGLIGEENAYLLGTLIVSAINRAAMARQAMNISDRENFYFYLDEFQNFVTPSMASILSGARKYHLGMVLAHQDLHQLWNRDTEVANSVISNPGTRICFRLGDFDSKKLADGFANFNSQDLQNLSLGEAIVRIDRIEYDFNLRTFPSPQIDSERLRERQEALISLSRKKYGVSKEEIEAFQEKDKVWVVETEKPSAKEPKKALTEDDKTNEPETPKKAEKKKRAPKKEEKSPIEEKLINPEIPVIEGKGGTQHRYLQALIKRMAEEKGYRAIIEQPLPDGSGSVDVGLEKDGHKVACEISVTTGEAQELKNIEKCLVAGYEQVILCSPEKKTLEKVKALLAEKYEESEKEKILLFRPEELFFHFEEQSTGEAGKEEMVKGYRVKVNYKPLNEKERREKREAIAQVILQSLQRNGGQE